MSNNTLTIETPKYVRVSHQGSEFVEIEDKSVSWTTDLYQTVDINLDMTNWLCSDDYDKPMLDKDEYAGEDSRELDSFVECFRQEIQELILDSEEIKLMIDKAYESTVAEFNKQIDLFDVEDLNGQFIPYTLTEEMEMLENEFIKKAKKQGKDMFKTIRFNDGDKLIAFEIVDKKEKVEEEINEDFHTEEYRSDIESGCPEGHITIWGKYNFEYKKFEDCSKEELVDYMKTTGV